MSRQSSRHLPGIRTADVEILRKRKRISFSSGWKPALAGSLVAAMPRRDHSCFFAVCSALLCLFAATALGSDFRLPVGTVADDVPLLLRPRVGMALSGGGVKLFFELGFLAEMESLGIPIDSLAGTSGGSIVAGYYGYGYTAPARYKKLLEDIDWLRLFRDQSIRRDPPFYREKSTQSRGLHIHFVNGRMERLVSNFFPEGLASGQKMYNILNRDLPRMSLFKDTRLDQMFTPVTTVSTRVKHPPGGEFRIYSGRLTEAIRTSVAFPILLPVYFWRENGGPAVAAMDGGLVNNIPVDVLSNVSAGSTPISKSLAAGRLPVPEVAVALDVTMPFAGTASRGGIRGSRNPSQGSGDAGWGQWLMKFVYGINFDPRLVNQKEDANRQLADVIFRLRLKNDSLIKLFDFRKQRTRDLYQFGRRMLQEELPIEIRWVRREENGKEVIEGPQFFQIEHLFRADRRYQGLIGIRQRLEQRMQETGSIEQQIRRFMSDLESSLHWPGFVRRDLVLLTETSEKSREWSLRIGWLDLEAELLQLLDERAARLLHLWRDPAASLRIEDVRIGRNTLLDQREFRRWLDQTVEPPKHPLSKSEMMSFVRAVCRHLKDSGLFTLKAVELAAHQPGSDEDPVRQRGSLGLSLIFDVIERNSARALQLEDLKGRGFSLAHLHEEPSAFGERAFRIHRGPTVRSVRLADLLDVEGKMIIRETRDGLILREFQPVLGKTFNVNSALKASERVYRQGLFHSVKFYLEWAGKTDEEVDLLVEIEEKPRAAISLAARYDLEENFTVYSRYSYDNLLGLGGTFFTDVLLGGITRWRTGVELPLWGNVFGHGELWSSKRDQELYRDGNAVDLYHRKRSGALFSLGYRPRPNWWHQFGYRLEEVHLDDGFQARNSGRLPVGDGRFASLVYRQGFNTLESFPFARTGFKLDLTLEAARKRWGSQYRYTRFELDIHKPFALNQPRDQVITFRASLGLSTGDLPIYELFGAGGVRENPLMGFNRRELLGKRLMTLNLSHRILLFRLPVPESRAFFGKLYWGTFVDGGFVSDLIKKNGFGRFRRGYGAGLLLDSNFGLIKLLYGINGERKGQLYFSLAYEI